MSLDASLLQLAVGTINKPTGVMVGLWPRAAAALGRQALEASLQTFWQRHEPSVADCSQRAQLLALPVYHDDPRLAREVGSVWNSLSRACHYHAYELPPTQSELQAMLSVAQRFAASVQVSRPGAK